MASYITFHNVHTKMRHQGQPRTHLLPSAKMRYLPLKASIQPQKASIQSRRRRRHRLPLARHQTRRRSAPVQAQTGVSNRAVEHHEKNEHLQDASRRERDKQATTIGPFFSFFLETELSARQTTAVSPDRAGTVTRVHPGVSSAPRSSRLRLLVRARFKEGRARNRKGFRRVAPLDVR